MDCRSKADTEVAHSTMNNGCHAMIAERLLVGWKRLPVNTDVTSPPASMGPAPSYVAEVRYACQFGAMTGCSPCGVTLKLDRPAPDRNTTPPLQIWRRPCAAKDDGLVQRIRMFGHARTKVMHEEPAIFDAFRPKGSQRDVGSGHHGSRFLC